MSQESQDNKKSNAQQPTEYSFGGIKEFNLEQIESEVLNESVYLDVFAGSDIRLKTKVVEVKNSLDKISQLDAITYQWQGDVNPVYTKDTNSTQVGLVAQQVAEIFPELVKKDQETGYLAVNYSKLTAHLVTAVKELNEIVKEQQKRILVLENAVQISDLN